MNARQICSRARDRDTDLLCDRDRRSVFADGHRRNTMGLLLLAPPLFFFFSSKNGRQRATPARKDGKQNGETSKGAALGKVSGSYSSSSNIDEKRPNGNSKLIRDAQQILSTLRRPTAAQSPVPTKKPLSEEICSSASSELIRFGLQEELSGQSALQPKSKDVLADDHKDGENSEVGSNITVTNSLSEISHSKAADDLGTFDIKSSSDTNHGWKPKGPKPNASPGFAASNIPATEPDAAGPKETTNASTSSIARSQVSDIAKMDQPDETQTPSTRVTDDGLNAGPSENNSGITNDATEENSNQLRSGMDEDSKGGECFAMAFSILSDSTSSCINGTKSRRSEIDGNMPEEKANMDEFPSFDLGF